jgi:hypothetical protein
MTNANKTPQTNPTPAINGVIRRLGLDFEVEARNDTETGKARTEKETNP